MRIKISGIQLGIFVVAIVLISGTAYYFTQNKMPNASTISGQPVIGSISSNAIGSPAPDFTLTTVDLSSGMPRKNVSLSDFKSSGKPTVFYFWATWCPFCRDELTKLKTIYPQYQDKVNFVVVDVDVEENSSIIANEVNSRGYPGIYTLPNVPMLQAYKIYETSTKYSLSRNGTILYSGAGEITPDQWLQIFNTAISA